MTEHDIQSQIQLDLCARGYRVFRANVGKVRMADGRWFDTGLPKGFSDLFAIKNGRVFFLEVKKPGGRIRDDQIHFINQMRGMGCRAGIVRNTADAIKVCEEEQQ